jgi:hypothetical protein
MKTLHPFREIIISKKFIVLALFVIQGDNNVDGFSIVGGSGIARAEASAGHSCNQSRLYEENNKRGIGSGEWIYPVFCVSIRNPAAPARKRILPGFSGEGGGGLKGDRFERIR